MKKLIRVGVVASFLFLTTGVIAQNATDTKPTEADEKFEKASVEFMRETIAEVNSMRTVENRIGFSSELAGLIWFRDENEGRAMYQKSIGDLRDLFGRIDGQISQFPVDDEDDSYRMFADVSGNGKLLQKFRKALILRQQIAQGISEHDPEMAFDFFYESLTVVTNPQLRKIMEQQDASVEMQLILNLVKTNPAKAGKFARKSLENGLKYQHIDLLQRLYAKDVDSGIDFGSAILSKIKSGDLKSREIWILGSLFSIGDQSLTESKKPDGKRPIYGQSEMRDLAETFANTLLENDSVGESSHYVDQIKKYAPARAAQLANKYKNLNRTRSVDDFETFRTASSAANAAAIAAGSGYGSGSGSGSDTVANSAPSQREIEEQRLREGYEKLTKGQLPKEERDKIVAEGRQILQSANRRDKKILGLSALATIVAKAGDKELADSIMNDARSLVTSQPTTYQDYLYTMMLVGGYAEVDPAEAFPILENSIYRVNETISAFVKVAEFIDASNEIIIDGEVQIGVFGGSTVRGLTGNLGIAGGSLKLLAKADMAALKRATNRFDRTEVRVLAKMMVLRALFETKGEVNESSEKEAEMGAPGFGN